MENMRGFPRLSLACEIEYSLNTSGTPENKETMMSKTRDISQGGICLITFSPLQIGDILNLRIRLKGFHKPFKALGKVVWTQTFEIGGQEGYDNGIEFIEIPEAQKGELKEFMQKMFSI
ncbi:MAG: PilZ domain-containing protein [Spirochaetales bacterium]|nr:PilZ domain-containing protein [Spirochaetales bacterium]